MTAAISLEELVGWNEESAAFWKQHFEANPAQLELPCDIGGAVTVQEFVRHIWAVELRWSQRIALVAVTANADFPTGPLAALYDLHEQAMTICRRLINEPEQDWSRIVRIEVDWLAPHLRQGSCRKLMAHGLLHSQRHWAQMATLLRNAGHPTSFRGDLLFSSALQ